MPEGAEVVLNPAGSAPMFVLRLGKAVLFFVPGVPREYRALVETAVLPRIDALRAERGETGFRALRLLKTVFLPESHLDARVRPLLPTHPQVTFGFRTHFPENHLKLMAEGRTRGRGPRGARGRGRRCAPAAGRPPLRGRPRDDGRGGGAAAARPAGDAGPGRELHRRAHRRHADRVAGGERVLPRERGVVRQPPQGSLGRRGARHARGERGRLRARGPGDGARSADRWRGAPGRSRSPASPARTAGAPRSRWAPCSSGSTDRTGAEVRAHRFHGDREQVRAASAYAALDWLRLRTRGRRR